MLRILKGVSINFRHAFATMILITFVVITTLPFWVGSKELNQQGWTYLVGSQGAITVLLTLAGRRYFEKADVKKLEIETIKQQPINDINNNTTTGVSHCKFSGGQDTTPLPQQPI